MQRAGAHVAGEYYVIAAVAVEERSRVFCNRFITGNTQRGVVGEALADRAL